VGESAGEVDRGAVGVAAWGKGELLELVGDGVDDRGMAKADLVDIVAVEIENGSALGVLKNGTVAGAQDIETGSGKRLMQEPPGIVLEGLPGIVVEMRFSPTGAVG
jgi:hypothetical protein